MKRWLSTVENELIKCVTAFPTTNGFGTEIDEFNTGFEYTANNSDQIFKIWQANSSYDKDGDSNMVWDRNPCKEQPRCVLRPRLDETKTVPTTINVKRMLSA